MATVVNLHVRNLDVTDDNIIDELELFENVWPGTQGNNVTLSVFVDDGERVVPTVLRVAEMLPKLFRGAYAHSVDPDLVSASDIAARTGFSREAIRQWSTKGHNSFPIEVSTISNSQKVWRWVEIAEWLCIHKNLDVDEDLPTPADVDCIDACLLANRNRFGHSEEWNQVTSPRSLVELTCVTSHKAATVHFTPSTRGSQFREGAVCVG